MEVICRSFSENAWKKDLCSNCYKSEVEHCFVEEKKKVVFTELKTNGTHYLNCKKMNANKVDCEEEANKLWFKTVTLNNEINEASDHNTEYCMKNKRNSQNLTSNEMFVTIKPLISPKVSRTVSGILKSKTCKSVSRKNSVQFQCDPIIIGYSYCDDYDSGNEEEEEDDCDDLANGDIEMYDDDSEFNEVTKANTSFNSNEQNFKRINGHSEYCQKIGAEVVSDEMFKETSQCFPVKNSLLSGSSDVNENTDSINSDDSGAQKSIEVTEDLQIIRTVLGKSEVNNVLEMNRYGFAKFSNELLDHSPTAIYSPGDDLFVCKSSNGSSSDCSSLDSGSKPTSLIDGYYDNLGAEFCNSLVKQASQVSIQGFSDKHVTSAKCLLPMEDNSNETMVVNDNVTCEEQVKNQVLKIELRDSRSELYNDCLNAQSDDEVQPVKPNRTQKQKPTIPAKPASLSSKIEVKGNSNINHINVTNGTEPQKDAQDGESQAKRDQRLAELAVELEQVRLSHQKRAAPLPPISNGDKNTIKKSINAPPPPRPPPPNLQDKSKFSIKKLLKLTNKESHEFETSNLKAWKQTVDFDRSKIQIIHPLELTGYDNSEAMYECISESSDTSSNSSNSSNKARIKVSAPTAPCRKNKSFEKLTSIDGKAQKTSTSSFYVHLSAPPHPNSPPPPPPPPSILTLPSSAETTRNRLSIASTTSSNSQSSPSPTNLNSPKISSQQANISAINMESSYSSIAKMNFDAINYILQQYLKDDKNEKIANDAIKYGICEKITPNFLLHRDCILEKSGETVNILCTSENYKLGSEAYPDIRTVDSKCHFVFNSEFDTFITLSDIVNGNMSHFSKECSVNQIAMIIVQLIVALRQYQANGLEELADELLTLSLLCLSSKRDDKVYILTPKADSIAKSECFSLQQQFTLCQCAANVLRSLNRKRDNILANVENVFKEEKAQSLSLAKNMCELILFAVPLNVSNQESLKYYLDLERSKFVTSFVINGTESTRKLLDYYYLLFLNKSHKKTLFDSIKRLNQ